MEKITLQTILNVLQTFSDNRAEKTTDKTPVFAALDTHSANVLPWIDAVSTNSKELADLTAAGHHTLFIPLVGERVDAHRFMQSAREAGAIAALASTAWLHTEAGQEFVSRTEVSLFSAKTSSGSRLTSDNHFDKNTVSSFLCIEVEDTLAAFQTLAAWYRGLFDIPVIGITGSVGKTTTKEMVSAALESALTIHKTAGNQNSQVGLPLTLFGLERRHKAAVIEMGMSEFGEMSRLAVMARPDHAIMTNIGVAHIGNLGSQENIRSEKLHITDFFHKGSTLFLNADDPLLAGLKEPLLPEAKLIYFGITDTSADTGQTDRTNRFPDFYATDIQVSGTGQTFLLHYPGGEPETIHLQVLGLHNVRNALAALAIAQQLGISPRTAGQGLASYAPLAMRGNLIEASGIQILDDSYNASPDSMKNSIEVLASLPASLPGSRRFIVFADVMELGERSEALHREVGVFLAAHNHKTGLRKPPATNASVPDQTATDQTAIDQTTTGQNTLKIAPMDYLITIGTESQFIENGYQAEVRTDDPPVECHHFKQNTEAIALLRSLLHIGDMVLVKGSRGMKTEEIVAALKQDKGQEKANPI